MLASALAAGLAELVVVVPLPGPIPGVSGGGAEFDASTAATEGRRRCADPLRFEEAADDMDIRRIVRVWAGGSLGSPPIPTMLGIGIPAGTGGGIGGGWWSILSAPVAMVWVIHEKKRGENFKLFLFYFLSVLKG